MLRSSGDVVGTIDNAPVKRSGALAESTCVMDAAGIHRPSECREDLKSKAEFCKFRNSEGHITCSVKRARDTASLRLTAFPGDSRNFPEFRTLTDTAVLAVRDLPTILSDNVQ